jgi:nitronate monooxygenase
MNSRSRFFSTAFASEQRSPRRTNGLGSRECAFSAVKLYETMTGVVMSTAFTKMFSVPYPIALAPMGGSAGGALAAAVSNGGGLGLIGSGDGDRVWLQREVSTVVERTSRPWGIGFLTWAIDLAVIERTMIYRPAAVMLSFGDPAPYVEPIHAAGAAVIVQVTDMEEAQQAVDVGADVIVAQGSESGGHGGRRGMSTLPFVPLVVDLASPTPVLAAGGIADGRGVAAALTLGAAGALIGTRFQATVEALVNPVITKAIIEAHGSDTELNTVLDIARGSTWPAKYPARTLGHPFLDEWRGRETELITNDQAKQAYRDGVARGDFPSLPIWAGESVGLIHDVPSARDLVATISAQAENALARATGH